MGNRMLASMVLRKYTISYLIENNCGTFAMLMGKGLAFALAETPAPL